MGGVVVTTVTSPASLDSASTMQIAALFSVMACRAAGADPEAARFLLSPLRIPGTGAARDLVGSYFLLIGGTALYFLVSTCVFWCVRRRGPVGGDVINKEDLLPGEGAVYTDERAAEVREQRAFNARKWILYPRAPMLLTVLLFTGISSESSSLLYGNLSYQAEWWGFLLGSTGLLFCLGVLVCCHVCGLYVHRKIGDTRVDLVDVDAQRRAPRLATVDVSADVLNYSDEETAVKEGLLSSLTQRPTPSQGLATSAPIELLPQHRLSNSSTSNVQNVSFGEFASLSGEGNPVSSPAAFSFAEASLSCGPGQLRPSDPLQMDFEQTAAAALGLHAPPAAVQLAVTANQSTSSSTPMNFSLLQIPSGRARGIGNSSTTKYPSYAVDVHHITLSNDHQQDCDWGGDSPADHDTGGFELVPVHRVSSEQPSTSPRDVDVRLALFKPSDAPLDADKWFIEYTHEDVAKNPPLIRHTLLAIGHWSDAVTRSWFCIVTTCRPQGIMLLVCHNLWRIFVVSLVAAISPDDKSHCKYVQGTLAAICIAHGLMIVATRVYRIPALNLLQGLQSILLGVTACSPFISSQTVQTGIESTLLALSLLTALLSMLALLLEFQVQRRRRGNAYRREGAA